MRETLIKRQEQEGSQHSTAQKVRTEANSQGMRNIPLEDLRRVIIAIEEQDIREAPFLEGFKLPNIKVYEGKSNPQDHIDHFNDLLELYVVSGLTKYRVFIVTLKKEAKKWFRSMISRSVTNWQ